MAARAETTVVYAAGVVQGVALVTFPAASLQKAGVDLPTLSAWAAAVAALLAVSSFVVACRRPSPASLHPHLGHAR